MLKHENGLVYVGIPRERIGLWPFIDNRDRIVKRIHEAGMDCGYYQHEGHRVDRNRDWIGEAFMEHPKKPDWLLMLDTDMEHPVTVAERLVKWNQPIVGALYFHRGKQHDPFVFKKAGKQEDHWGRMQRVWAPMKDEVYEFLKLNNVPMMDGAFTIDPPIVGDPLISCDAVATGSLLLHRSVLEKMPEPWFEYEAGGNSEDLTFCDKAKFEFDIPIHCDLSTVCGHYNWVAMGQAQFRIRYEQRGVDFTNYSKREASNWLSEFWNITTDEALETIESGSAHMVGELWTKEFGDRTDMTAEEVETFYRREDVGKMYLIELLHWNFSGNFGKMRQPLTSYRDMNVLEIGAGIGSVAIQMLIQNNEVIAVEANQHLRDFIDFRYQKIIEKAVGEFPGFSIVDETWEEHMPDESADLVIALDVIEHLQLDTLEHVVKSVGRVLKPGGRFFYHANWYQQDLYPMHFEAPQGWLDMLRDAGLLQVTNMEAMKIL
jgi:2-polyprenyl-3-methyl-5-hydroxy-6-metoxy-1,4-benzoquinol methylase